MRRLFLAIVVGSLLILGAFKANQQERESPDCGIAQDALDAVSHIRPGITRSDLHKDFIKDGGMQFLPQERYFYRRCHLIKVDIKFRAATSAKEFSPNDVVTEVSKPYLEYPIAD